MNLRCLAAGVGLSLAASLLVPIAESRPVHAATTLNPPPFAAGQTPDRIYLVGNSWLISSRSSTAPTSSYYFTGDRATTWVTPPPAADGWEARADVSELRRLVLGSCTSTPCTATSARLEAFSGTGEIRTVSNLTLPSDVGSFETLRPRWFDGYYWAFACSSTGGDTTALHKVTLLRIGEDGTTTRFSRTDGQCGSRADIVRTNTGQLRIPRMPAGYELNGSALTPIAGSLSLTIRPDYGFPAMSVDGTWRVGAATFARANNVFTVDYGAGALALTNTGDYGFVGGTSGLPLLRIGDRAITIDRGDGVFVPSYFFSRQPKLRLLTPDGLVLLTCPRPACTATTDYRLELLPTSEFTSPLPVTSTHPMIVKANQQRATAGLPPLHEDAAISQAAQNHSNYMQLHGLGHFETPGVPGFTGEAPMSRCEAVGAACYGEIAASAGSPAAVDYWLGAPYHGVPLLDPTEVVAGASSNPGWGVMNFGGAIGLSTRGFGFPQGAWGGALIWSGGETPDPRAVCPPPVGEDFGYPIYYQAARGVKVGTMRLIANGQELPVCTIRAGLYFPMSPLAASTTYTVTVETPGYVSPTDSWTFTTAVAPPSSSPKPKPKPTPNPTAPKSNSVNEAFKAAIKARAVLRNDVVVVNVSGLTTYLGRGVKAKVKLWRAGAGQQKPVTTLTTTAKGVCEARFRVPIPPGQRERALAWYRKTWPDLRVMATYRGLTYTARVRVG